MENLISLSGISKGFGAKKLFESLSLTIHQGERVAVIGQNGSGKSTLLKLMMGLEVVDSGLITKKKNLNVSYVYQAAEFPDGSSVYEIVLNEYENRYPNSDESVVEASKALSVCGFENFDEIGSQLSGGWKKRLAIACALVTDPELLLLDEPTNHMDWQTIDWLEKILISSRTTFVLISHDRYFLNKVTNRTIEIGKSFMNEHLSFSVPYDEYILKRESYFEEQQKQFESLGNKARRELEWLRAGVKARTTKSRSRIKGAYELFDKVQTVNDRIKNSKAKIDIKIDESGRKTKKLIELKQISKSYDEHVLYTDLDLLLTPKSRLALLGENGSGKTTLVKTILGDIAADSGTIKKADKLKVVYFDQSISLLDVDQSIFEFLAEGSEQVIFKDKPIHVASYAAKFLFTKDHFFLKISQLSGGERARLQLAKILLRPCDILILDEPTNDLDIESIEALEELLLEMKTAIVLISHDRDFLTNICDQYLALEGDGRWTVYAELEQWFRSKDLIKKEKLKKIKKSEKNKKKSMSFKEKKELESIEADILKEEDRLKELNDKIVSEADPVKLKKMTEDLSNCELLVQKMYKRWQELEDMKN